MRAAARGAVAALQRRWQNADLISRSLQQAQTLSTRIATDAASGSQPRGPLGRAATAAAAAAAAATLAYGFSAQPVVAQAEAPWQPEASTAGPPVDERYQRPTPQQLQAAPGGGGLPREPILLYQYDVCPFCCKVKAFLDYHKIPYRCVEVNPLTKAEVKWSKYKKVPIVVIDGEQLNDSSAIITRLATAAEARSAAGGGGSGKRGWFGGGGGRARGVPAGASAAEEEKWRRWVDDWFVRVITVNIYRNMHESFQTFDYISEQGNFGWVSREAARVVGATMMWGIGGKLKKKYGVEGDVRQALYKSADEWVDAVGERRFLGGDAPDLADLAVFGVVRSITATDTFNDLMHHSRIGGWYVRMFEAVGPPARLL